MASRLSLAILVACLVAAQDVAVAQVAGGDVTLKVPLNLTKLSTDLVKVRVSCALQSTALRTIDAQGQETQRAFVTSEVPVSNGQVITTLTLVFSKFTLVNPAGVTATYGCSLGGTDNRGQGSVFEASNPFLPFRVSPTPANLTGTFTW